MVIVEKDLKINNYNNITIWLKNEFIYGAHFLSLAYPALFLTLIIVLELPINYLAIAASYLIPLIVYSFNYQKELDKDIVIDPDKVAYLKNREKVFPYLMGLYLLLLIAILFLLNNWGFGIFITIILLGGILYTIVFKTLTQIVPGFKSVYTAMLWAYAGTFCVIFFYSLPLSMLFIVYFVFLFIKGVINVVYYDIKDIKVDKMNNLKTFPIILGVKNSLLMLHALNIIDVIILCYAVYIKIFPLYMISLALFTIYVYYYLLKGNVKNNKELIKYTYLMVDGECLLWPIVLLISKYAFNFFLH